jgi:hypothetical protein
MRIKHRKILILALFSLMAFFYADFSYGADNSYTNTDADGNFLVLPPNTPPGKLYSTVKPTKNPFDLYHDATWAAINGRSVCLTTDSTRFYECITSCNKEPCYQSCLETSKLTQEACVEKYDAIESSLRKIHESIVKGTYQKETRYANDLFNMSLDERLNNESIAMGLGAKKIEVSSDYGLGSIKSYNSADIPDLGENEVLIKGASRVIDTEDSPGYRIVDTYYVSNIADIPKNYTLAPSGMINRLSDVEPEDRGEYPELNENGYIPVYKIDSGNKMLDSDLELDKKGIFSFNFENTEMSKSIIGRVANYWNTFWSGGNDAISGHIAQKIYSENAATTLKQFGDYGRSVSSQLPQADREAKIYNYVNKNIVFHDALTIDGTHSISISHSLEQAVASKEGVCRDKAAALEYTLEANGIKANRVVSDNHVFVAVLKPDGKVDHYLDPTYYETYLPLSRPNVKPNQLIPNTYGKNKK